jgi:hypothetical protein
LTSVPLPGVASYDCTTPSRIGSAANRKDCNVREKFSLNSSVQCDNEDFAVIVRSVDWGRLRWEFQEISEMELRHVRGDRNYQHALDEAITSV